MKATIIKPEKQDENKQQRKLRVAAYARVSTTSEEQKSSFVNQIEYENKIKKTQIGVREFILMKVFQND